MIFYLLCHGPFTVWVHIVGWKGATSDPFEEKQGTRQGSRTASDEYKSYNSPVLDTLESLVDNDCGYKSRDTITGHATTVVAVAEDTALSTICLLYTSDAADE